MADQLPPNSKSEENLLGLEGFRRPTEEQGVSLDQLAQAFAGMLESGADPYAPITDTSSSSSVPAEAPPEACSSSLEEQEAWEITPRGIIEAALFVGNTDNEPLGGAKIAGLMRGVRPAEIDEIVQELNRQYEVDGSPYRISSEGEGYRLTLCEEFFRIRDKLFGRSRQAKLSPTAMEVLSLVAYRGPLTGEEVAQLRGNIPSGPILSQLVRRELLQVERVEGKPRIIRYHVTRRFMDLFGLESLADLPQSQDLDRR